MKNMNQMEANRLDNMRNELSEKALEVIATTDINIMHETFGGMTAEQINEMAGEYYEY